MSDNRCPSCENDISQTVTSAIMKTIRGDDPDAGTITCPHCGRELHVSVNVATTLSAIA